MVFIVGSYI